MTTKAGIYIASKTRHAPRWRELRASGVPIISTWIDEAGPGETACFVDLWERCIDEVTTAAALVIYCEEGDVLKGAFVEVGAALAAGVHVYAVGCEAFSFANHKNVRQCANLWDALVGAQQIVADMASELKRAPILLGRTYDAWAVWNSCQGVFTCSVRHRRSECREIAKQYGPENQVLPVKVFVERPTEWLNRKLDADAYEGRESAAQ